MRGLDAPAPVRGTVAVAMSGGVDSSVVAALLKRDGYALVGMTLQLWNQRRLAGRAGMPAEVHGRCCSLDDVYDARAIASLLDIPYYVVNQEERFEQEVVKPFVADYLAGRTPIPCTLCNNYLKFDELIRTAVAAGAEKVATGHYARLLFDDRRQRWVLSRPADLAKDQTYFLFGLTQEQLSRSLFPLGEMTKPEVRELAREFDLPLAAKPDSHEICFVPGNDYTRFLDAYLDEQGWAAPDMGGSFLRADGQEMAEHGGVHRYTVGQRKGLGVTAPNPLYVLGIDPETRDIRLGEEAELYSSELRAERCNWVSVGQPDAPVRLQAKIRYRHEAAWATVTPEPGDRVRVEFDEPQRAITPGQAVVFYDGIEVAGGGWIL